MQFWLVVRVVKGDSFGWLLEWLKRGSFRWLLWWLKRVILDGYYGG